MARGRVDYVTEEDMVDKVELWRERDHKEDMVDPALRDGEKGSHCDRGRFP